MQIVITEEIDSELFQWLSSLTDKLTEEKAPLMELMRPEVEKYAREYAQEYAQEYTRKNDMEHAVIMIQRGEDNDYIKLLTHLTDKEINALRKDM